MAALGFDLGPPPFCYTPHMASFGRKPKAPTAEPAATPEPELEPIRPEAEREVREAYKGGHTYPPTHDDEW